MISSTDIAGATANDARRSSDDAHTLIKWLIARIEALEVASGLAPCACPELPSQREQRIYREMHMQEMAEMRQKYQLMFAPIATP